MTQEIQQSSHWQIDHRGGLIRSLSVKIDGVMRQVPMRQDQYGGICWIIEDRPVPLQLSELEPAPVYTGNAQVADKTVHVSLSYSIHPQGALEITAAISNPSAIATIPFRAGLRLGFDSFLVHYPDYLHQFFPTLIRCEKTHLWGYFSAPDGGIITIFTDTPVASYTLEYEKDAQGIFTASIDLLHPGPLPPRHPTGLDHLAPGEEKIWHIFLFPLSRSYDLEGVKPAISAHSLLPTLHADLYTVAPGECSCTRIFSNSPIRSARLTTPDGSCRTFPLSRNDDGVYLGHFQGWETPGVYTLDVENDAGFRSQMCLSVRNYWSWYIRYARKAAIDAPQKASTHAESWYGLYSGFLARRHFPDPAADRAMEDKFQELLPLLYCTDTMQPRIQPDRIQNHSSMVGVLVMRYACTKCSEDLRRAWLLAQVVLSFQKSDGGFYKGNTDYTSVIYPAKSLTELLRALLGLLSSHDCSPEQHMLWYPRAHRLSLALMRTMDHLASLEGNFQTEGATTSCYEDGANSCSAAQLGAFALMLPPDSPRRHRYICAARRIVDAHASHEQALIPDSRMTGGTLRYWEAQYDVEMGKTPLCPRAQMMDSPHGWSAWNAYALIYLYQLTGDVAYLIRGMNTLGACAQLMSWDGVLRWAFVPDPYRETQLFVPENGGTHIPAVVGETYIPMISSWWCAPQHQAVSGYTAMGGAATQGACCDNDVHEAFKAIGELALTRCYVHQQSDGTFLCCNAHVARSADTLILVPLESVVTQAIVCVTQECKVKVLFSGGEASAQIHQGIPRLLQSPLLPPEQILTQIGEHRFAYTNN